jgi:cytochrome P450
MFGHDFETLSHPERGIRDRFALLLAEFSGPAWVRLIMYFVDLRPLFSLLSPLVMPLSGLGQALSYVRGAVDSVVAENEDKFRASGKEDVNITSVSVASGMFPRGELVDNGMLFLTAGPNSTGTAIEWALYELGQRPEMQKRLRDEIRASLGGPATIPGSSPGDDTDTMGSKLASLQYLNAICSEVIRCYPFVPLSPKVTEKDTTLMGVKLPKGTPLAVPVEALNRDPTLWGPDADKFNPERWLGDGDRALTGGAPSNFAMLSFGAGPNICIGQNQARAFLACCVAAVVQRFELRLANADTAGRLRVAPYKKSEEGPMVRLTPVAV